MRISKDDKKSKLIIEIPKILTNERLWIKTKIKIYDNFKLIIITKNVKLLPNTRLQFINQQISNREDYFWRYFGNCCENKKWYFRGNSQKDNEHSDYYKC